MLQIFRNEGCNMVEMPCEAHDQQAANTQFITHTVGRILGAMELSSTPINTKGYESLLSLVENTANDTFDLYYGLFMYNQVSLLARRSTCPHNCSFSRCSALLGPNEAAVVTMSRSVCTVQINCSGCSVLARITRWNMVDSVQEKSQHAHRRTCEMQNSMETLEALEHAFDDVKRQLFSELHKVVRKQVFPTDAAKQLRLPVARPDAAPAPNTLADAATEGNATESNGSEAGKARTGT